MIYTWRDVDERLKSIGSPPWEAFDVDTSTLTFGLAQQQADLDVHRALSDCFGAAFDPVRSQLNLVSIPSHPRTLDVVIKHGATDVQNGVAVARPLWSSRAPVTPPPVDEAAPIVSAFYSYKGGVGRTTVAVAVLGEILTTRPEARVLFVDADLEAPGLTWLLQGEEELSLLDALAIVHDAHDWREEALPVLAGLLESSRQSLELPVGRREFYFLPAMRSIAQLFAQPITFENVMRGRSRAYVIGDMFLALAQTMRLDAVLIDMRAGITEFSSPLLLDPRVTSVLVTSCNQQSVRGTLETLGALNDRLPSAARDAAVVITMVPPDSGSLAQDIAEQLFEALKEPPNAGANTPIIEDVVGESQWLGHEVQFAQELLHFDSFQDLVARRIPGTTLGKTVAPALVERFMPRVARSPARDIIAAASPPSYERVHQKAHQLEFAEQNALLGLLPIPALRKLVELPPGRLPAAVILGQKGAGKTFAWGQMVLSERWAAFRAVIVASTEASAPSDALIFPLLHPKSLKDELNERVKSVEEAVLRGRDHRWDSLDLSEAMDRVTDADGGIGFWLRATAARLGLEESATESVRSLEAALVKLDCRVILVIDGIEDALQPSPGQALPDRQRKLLRGLLQDLTTRIRELNSTYLGIVTFVRRDFAMEAVAQNFRQFEALHRDFAIHWSPTDTLRLPVWLCEQVGWYLLPPGTTPSTASIDELSAALHPFWGERLGGSREAYTNEWVIAALSDLQGRIQARDLVRLIRFATMNGGATANWPLPASKIRDALKPCAELKISELEAEVRQLGPILGKLRNAPASQRSIPFNPSSLKLNATETGFLEDQGLITKLGEKDEYYMPEIIRQGLGFDLQGGRRAKVLALYRAAMRKARG